MQKVFKDMVGQAGAKKLKQEGDEEGLNERLVHM